MSTVTLWGVDVNFSTEVACLGIVFDQELTSAVHIRRLTGNCFYHLWHTVRRTLTTDEAKKIVHAFITSRMDYCNSFVGVAGAVRVNPRE